jgi:Na+/pantothenate symporter
MAVMSRGCILYFLQYLIFLISNLTYYYFTRHLGDVVRLLLVFLASCISCSTFTCFTGMAYLLCVHFAWLTTLTLLAFLLDVLALLSLGSHLTTEPFHTMGKRWVSCACQASGGTPGGEAG